MTGGAGTGSSARIAPEILRLISYETMRRQGIVPLGLREGKLRLAMVNKSDVVTLDDIRIKTGYELEIYPVSKEELDRMLQQNFELLSEHPVCPALAVDVKRTAAGENLQAPDTFAVQSVDKLIGLAVSMRASDIHLEPQQKAFFVRFRVDGVLKTIHEYPKEYQASIVSRLKVMAGMDISEKRLPLDGQISLETGAVNVDLRVSTMPGKYGETVVIRLLNKSNVMYGLEKLGLSPAAQSAFESLIERPHGIILVTGPTGSGKTSTLYAVLNRIKSPLINIITLEDPIEYELLAGSGNQMGITQVQVQPRIGMTFAAGLRASLRQDPDVIMVGEIRDKETAETAMTAAMTGHLVLSTLHTNDAPSAVGRLVDMGIEPYLISTTLAGVLAQRLVRLLCPRCKEEYRPPLRALKNMFPGRADLDTAVFFRPKGCDNCRGTGYAGRQGIFELLLMNDEIKQRIHDGDNLGGIRRAMQAQGMKSLSENGIDLVFRGLTTVEEVSRVAVE